VGRQNDITRVKDGNFYIADQEAGDKPAYVCLRDAKETVLARIESRHIHGVDSRGNIHAGLTTVRSVDPDRDLARRSSSCATRTAARAQPTSSDARQ
jgi:hypothetical protein